MLCIKCKKEIPDGFLYCNFCGKKQIIKPKPKYHKREHGTGTIRCDKRYKNPWIAVAPSSKYGQGRTYIGSFATRNEAKDALDDFIKRGRPELYNATVGEIYEMWSKSHFRGVSESAVHLYTHMWKRFQNVKELPMRELRTAHIQEIINAATSKSACDIIKTMAVMLCKFAMENDVVNKNYAEFVKIPKFEKKEKRIFTTDEIDQLWKHSDDKNVQAVLLMIYTGFRSDVFYGALEAADIEPTGLTPHCCRHTFASLSAAAGVKPENLQKIIGHANYSTTAEVYIHQNVTTLIEEMRKISK